MKRSRFSEEKIVSILREADGESTVKAVCAKHNISDATFYNWKRKLSKKRGVYELWKTRTAD